MILCLDLGTKTGWVLGDKENFYSGIENFTQNRFEGGGMRFLRFKNWLYKIMITCQEINNPIKSIYFEEVRRHLGTDASHIYGGFLSHLTVFGDENKIPYSGIPVGTIKKHITGKGNASKKLVIDSLLSKGYKPTDHNEADAMALFDLKINTIN